MKTIKLFTVLFIVALMSVAGCQKDYPALTPNNPCNNSVVRDTIRIRDTIVIHDTIAPVPLTKTQILAQKEWIVDEIARSLSGTISQFIRGGMNTTGTNYTLLKFKFNTNGTGTYRDENGIVHSLNWIFTNPSERNMRLDIGAPFATVFNWNMVEIKDNYLHSTTVQGSNVLVTARLIQVP